MVKHRVFYLSFYVKIKIEISGIMEILYGIVKEVYIPLEYNENNNFMLWIDIILVLK